VHPETQQVQLRQADALQVILVVLATREPLRPRRLQRHHLRETALGRPEHHAPAVGAGLPDAPDEPRREFQQQPVPLRVLQGVALHRRFRQRLLPAGEAGVDPVAVPEAGRDVAGENVDLARRVPERPRRHPYGPPQGHRLHRRGLRDAARAGATVAPNHLEAHLVAPDGAEVQVHVRGVLASLVQETLEEQAVGERFGLGQAQAVRDQAVGSTSSSRDGDALLPRYPRRLVRDQEIRREPQGVDTT
jgi:hypothetical protein